MAMTIIYFACYNANIQQNNEFASNKIIQLHSIQEAIHSF